MSSGQRAYEDELAEQAAKEHYDRIAQEHYDRIAQLGPSKIIEAIDKLTEHFRYLEASLPSLPCSCWYRIYEIKKELRKLA